jgi:hypothetical protein
VRTERARSASGTATLELVTASGLALVLLVLVANLLVDLYARGAIRHALDEGVRAGAPVDAAPGACELAADGALDDLLGGRVGEGVDVRCEQGPTDVVARADAVLPSWLPALVPDWSFTLTSESTRE